MQRFKMHISIGFLLLDLVSLCSQFFGGKNWYYTSICFIEIVRHGGGTLNVLALVLMGVQFRTSNSNTGKEKTRFVTDGQVDLIARRYFKIKTLHLNIPFRLLYFDIGLTHIRHIRLTRSYCQTLGNWGFTGVLDSYVCCALNVIDVCAFGAFTFVFDL